MHYLYIIKCSDGTLYTGTAKDVDARINQHNAGKGARYTRGRSPVTLLYKETFKTVGEALKREYEIKQWSRSKKIKFISQEAS